MSIRIEPDPDHPLGGHALIIVPSGGGGAAALRIENMFDERFLGPKGWQSAPVDLGPYETREIGDDLAIPVGPEVVDHIEEYARLRISAAGVEGEATWPDGVAPSPAAAGLGGFQALNQTMERPPEPKPTPPPEPKPEPPRVEQPQTPHDAANQADEGGKTKSQLPLFAGLGLLALLIAGGAIWWFAFREPTGGAQPLPGCDDAALRAAASLPSSRAMAQIAACGAEGDPELRFAVIERAVAADDPDGLLMMGRWWDPQEAEAVGSTFHKPDAAQAANYYKKAQQAGQAEAAELLARACSALDPVADPTHLIAQTTHCQ